MPAAAEIAWLIPLLPLAGAAFIGLLLTTFNLTMNRLSKPVAVLSMSCIGAAGARRGTRWAEPGPKGLR